MAYIVTQSADGQYHQFPEGTPPAIIDKAMADYARQQNAPAKGAPVPKQPNTYADVIKSAATGGAEGVAGIVGLPGDIGRVTNWVMGHLGMPTRDLNKPAQFANGNSVTIPGGELGLGANPGSGQVNRDIQSVTGPYHQPETVPGEYARTIASFVSAAALPGSIPMRIGRVAIPAITSETAGQFTKGTDLEPVARVVGGLAGGLATSPTIRSINALSSRVGVPLENPQSVARDMLADAAARDGGRDQVRQGVEDWRGNSNPAVIDVTGNNVRRLVRSAASGGSGEAQNVAINYGKRVAGNLQDNALTLTRNLTPDTPQGATQYASELEAAQRADANANYRAPYSQPAVVTKEMVSALQGPEGQSAIRQAWLDARANRDVQQMGELKDLEGVAAEQGGTPDVVTGKRRTLQQALSELSSGALDRVRIAMRDTGRGLAAAGRNSRAGGYFDRVRDIDTALDQTPGLRDARASYRNFANQGEAVDLGRTGLNASPEDYGATILRLSDTNSPGLRAAMNQSSAVSRAAGVGYRQALTDAISKPAEGATGVLNRIATSETNTQNLGNTFGRVPAQDYQTGIGNEISRVENARFISPNTGSQTMLRAEDMHLLDIPTSKTGFIAHVWDKLKSATQLTDAERTELVRLGTTEAQLVNLARRNPSLTSRALTSAILGRAGGPQN